MPCRITDGPQYDDVGRERTEPDHDAIAKAQRLDDDLQVRRHSKFRELTDELFADMGTLPLDRLNEIDRRKLAAAYLLDAPGEIHDALRHIKPECVVECIATLIRHSNRFEALDDADLIDLGSEIWAAMWPNPELQASLEAEYDHCARRWNSSGQDRHGFGRRQAD